MTSQLLYAIGYLVIALFALRDSKRYKSLLLSLVVWFGIVGSCVEMLCYYLIISDAPRAYLSITQISLWGFNAIMIIAIIWAGSKSLSDKNRP